MNRVRYLALGVALAAVAGCWAVSGGGLPSFPSFQAVGIGTAAPAAGNLALSGSMTAGSVPDARLTANVVKYTDSGTNFTGATKPTVGGNAICTVAGGVACPMLASLEVTSTGGTAVPTITWCNHCVSPSISRLGAGNWQVTLGITPPGNSVAICAIRGNFPSNFGTVYVYGDMTGSAGTILIRWMTVAGGLTDPASSNTVDCAIVN